MALSPFCKFRVFISGKTSERQCRTAAKIKPYNSATRSRNRIQTEKVPKYREKGIRVERGKSQDKTLPTREIIYRWGIFTKF